MRIGIIRVMIRILMLMRFRGWGGWLMNACMLAGRWGMDLTSYGGAERASLVLQNGMPVGKASVRLF